MGAAPRPGKRREIAERSQSTYPVRVRPSQPPGPPPAPAPNTRFASFTLVERLAVGGMAEVFRAIEPRTAGADRVVVIKRMLPHIAAEPGAGRMFEEEARLAALVEHPNVVRVLGSGAEGGQPFLALELVPGLDLARFQRWRKMEREPLSPSLALFIVTELLAGLHAVHEATEADGAPLGIVHGDVSPSNVLLSDAGDVKLADFGIAEARLRSRFPQAAAAGRTKGKLGYLSPEQVRGEKSDRRSDVFAAAVVAAELLIDEPLFARGSELAILLAVRNADLRALDQKADALPADMVEVLRRGLARDPAERFETAAAMRKALLSLAAEPAAAKRGELGGLVAIATGGARATLPEGFAPTEDEITREPPLDDYVVVRADGSELGSMTFAQLVEGLTTGAFGPTDWVRIGGTPARKLADVPELAGHLPAEPGGASDAVPIAGGGLVDALARSAAARATGAWICRRGDVRKEVYLIDGVPEFVSSNLPHELLGEFLVARGTLDRGELEMALAVLPRFDGRLGDTLAALGLIEPVELFRHISDQVKEKLLELFTWDAGAADFHDGAEPPDRYFPLGLDPWWVISAGIERRLEAGLEEDTFAPHMLDSLVRTRAAAPDALPRDVERVLSLARARKPLPEVVDALEAEVSRDVHRPYRAIRLALALGLVAWA